MNLPTREWLSEEEKNTLFSRLVFNNRLNRFISSIFPQKMKLRMSPLSYGTEELMRFASRTVQPGERVLDAGAGSCQYKKYFSHAKYESADFDNVFSDEYRHIHDFTCSLDDIPRPDNYYGAIINTQVLEHVEFPQKVIDEFYRILKPGGKLFLTAPQGMGLHASPYNYYNFLKPGLELLFTHAGFTIVFVNPIKGIFCHLGKSISILGPYVMNQYLFASGRKGKKLNTNPFLLVVLPLYLILLPLLRFFIPYLFFYLDVLDKRKDWTIGYACYCIKPLKSSLEKTSLNRRMSSLVNVLKTSRRRQ